jgi:hypothetical protein
MHTMRTMALALAALALALPAVAAPVPLPKVAGGDADKLLLDDAEVILVINAKQMMGSELMKKGGGAAAIKDMVKQNEQVKEIVDATGLDLTKDIDSLVASATTSGKEPRSLMVVKGTFDVEKIQGAMKKKAEKTHTEGKQTVYEIKTQKEPLFAVVADKSTIVLGHSKELAAERAAKGGKKAAKLHKDMSKALKGFTGKESMVMVVLVTDEMQKQFGQLPPKVADHVKKLTTLTASMTMTDTFTLNISGVTGDQKAAKGIATQLDLLKATGAALLAGQEGVPPGVTDVLDAIKITSTKEAAKIDLKLTKEQIEKIGKSDN